MITISTLTVCTVCTVCIFSHYCLSNRLSYICMLQEYQLFYAIVIATNHKSLSSFSYLSSSRPWQKVHIHKSQSFPFGTWSFGVLCFIDLHSQCHCPWEVLTERVAKLIELMYQLYQSSSDHSPALNSGPEDKSYHRVSIEASWRTGHSGAGTFNCWPDVDRAASYASQKWGYGSFSDQVWAAAWVE